MCGRMQNMCLHIQKLSSWCTVYIHPCTRTWFTPYVLDITATLFNKAWNYCLKSLNFVSMDAIPQTWIFNMWISLRKFTRYQMYWQYLQVLCCFWVLTWVQRKCFTWRSHILLTDSLWQNQGRCLTCVPQCWSKYRPAAWQLPTHWFLFFYFSKLGLSCWS